MTTKLLRVGMKLAVLGCAPPDVKFWHIMNPGSWNIPQLSGSAGNHGLTVGKTLCGINAYSNGYAVDWRPPEGQLCPACNERL